jgi:hypothetical protein
VSDLEGLAKDYRVAFLRYLPGRDEAALMRAYEIGRAAVAAGVSVLHLSRIHHLVLAEVLSSTPAEELPQVAAAGSEFLMEVLAPFDMAGRRRPAPPDASTPTT